jgi:hypothetical protein
MAPSLLVALAAAVAALTPRGAAAGYSCVHDSLLKDTKAKPVGGAQEYHGGGRR